MRCLRTSDLQSSDSRHPSGCQQTYVWSSWKRPSTAEWLVIHLDLPPSTFSSQYRRPGAGRGPATSAVERDQLVRWSSHTLKIRMDPSFRRDDGVLAFGLVQRSRWAPACAGATGFEYSASDQKQRREARDFKESRTGPHPASPGNGPGAPATAPPKASSSTPLPYRSIRSTADPACPAPRCRRNTTSRCRPCRRD